MKLGDVVVWQRYSGDVFARVLSVTKRTVTLDVCGVRVTVARGEVRS